MKSWTRRRRDINHWRQKQVLTPCAPRNRSIDNANQRDGARIRTRKEWGELHVHCIRGMSVPSAVQRHALPILKTWSRRQRDINQQMEKQVLTHCVPRNRSIDNEKQRDGGRIRTQNEWGELSGECRCRANKRRRDNIQRRKEQVLTHCESRNRTIDNANQRNSARIETRKEWGELHVYVECRCRGGHIATLTNERE